MAEKTNIDSEVENRFLKDKNVQSDLAPLSSLGKIYPATSPLHGKTKIQIKAMTAQEEDILNSRAYLKQGVALDKLLSAVVIDKNIKLDELIVGDKNTILLYVRILGYGPEYNVDNMKCESCDKNFKTTIDLSTIKTRILDDVNPVEDGVNRFEFTLPRANKKVFFHLLTNKDDNEISKAEENKKKIGSIAPTPITTQIYFQVDDIEGTDVKDKMNFIKGMSAYDSKELRNYIDSITPGPIMKQEITCPYCEDVREQNVPIGAGFFWPRR
jgi:hypothetical protein